MKVTHLKTLYILCLLAISYHTHAQQLPQFTQYAYHQYAYNPAYTPQPQPAIHFQAAARFQWLGLPGYPATQYLYATTPLFALKGNTGILITNDQLGVQRTTTATLSYNYQLNLKKNKYLNIGIAAQAQQTTLNTNQLTTPQGNYQNNQINHNDNIINPTPPQIKPNANIGIQYQTPNLTLSLSALQLIPNPTNIGTQKTHLFTHIAYNFYLLNDNLQLTPSISAISDLKKHQPEIALYTQYNQKIIAGITLRSLPTPEAIALIAGIQPRPNYRLTYSYDITLSPLRNTQTGTHEITLQYHLKNLFKTNPTKVQYNTRFL